MFIPVCWVWFCLVLFVRGVSIAKGRRMKQVVQADSVWTAICSSTASNHNYWDNNDVADQNHTNQILCLPIIVIIIIIIIIIIITRLADQPAKAGRLHLINVRRTA
ncbi:hypothetical protein V1524DRAFT_76792 [Lipomyces starkeyi]